MSATPLRKIALITGAAQGIGAAIAEALSDQVDCLVLLDIAPGWESKTDPVRSTRTLRYHCDVGSSAQVEKTLDAVEKQIGLPTVLVNNAGRGGPFHRVDEVSDDEWFDLVATNLKSVFNLSRRLLPAMKRQASGKIVNIASIQGFLGAARSSTYVACKHGVIGYTRAIAAEWGAYGITCNAVCPGYVGTAMGLQDSLVNGHSRRVIDATPAQRIAKPSEVANLVKFLVGPDADFINGAVMTIDGGLSAHVGVT